MEVTIQGAKVYGTIPILGGIPITETMVVSWVVIVVLAVVCKVLTHNLQVRPTSKRQLVAEFLVEKATGLVTGNMGESFREFTPFITALMSLSCFSSLSSLFGCYPPTADVNNIAGWAIVVFFMITFYKLRGGFLNYLKGFTQPVFILTPFNIISEVATPISMTFRHFGNIVSGMVISTLIYAALTTFSGMIFKFLPGALASFPFLTVGIPVVFSLYFDIFSALLQAYIFAMLTMLYVSGAAEDNPPKSRRKKAARATPPKAEKQQKVQ